MTIYKEWYIFLVLVSTGLPANLWAFSFVLSKPSIQVGETTILRIELPESGRDGKPLVLDELLSQHSQLKVLERNMSQGDNSVSFTFEITAYKAGDYRIPPIQIKWGSDSFSTEALDLNVGTTRDPDDREIRADFDTLKTPFPWRKAYFWVMASFALLLGFWLLRWTLMRIPWKNLKRLSFKFRWPSFETDKMWLRKEIARLRNELTKGPATPELVDRIFYTLSLFLKRKTNSPVPALTSQELLGELSDKSIRSQMGFILKSTDHFKYELTDKANAPKFAEELLSTIEKVFL